MKQSLSKTFVIGTLFLLNFCNRSAAQVFDKGALAINAGVGFIGTFSYAGFGGVHRSPAYCFAGEYGLMKLGPGVLGAGVAFGLQTASYTQSYGSYYYKDRWTSTLFGLRATYHPDFLKTEKSELYGIVQLSLMHFGYSFSSNDPYVNSSLYGGHSISSAFHPYIMLGARYYFSKNFGVYSELGYDIALIKAGITLKF